MERENFHIRQSIDVRRGKVSTTRLGSRETRENVTIQVLANFTNVDNLLRQSVDIDKCVFVRTSTASLQSYTP